jgi:hypothetical protein
MLGVATARCHSSTGSSAILALGMLHNTIKDKCRVYIFVLRSISIPSRTDPFYAADELRAMTCRHAASIYGSHCFTTWLRLESSALFVSIGWKQRSRSLPPLTNTSPTHRHNPPLFPFTTQSKPLQLRSPRKGSIALSSVFVLLQSFFLLSQEKSPTS